MGHRTMNSFRIAAFIAAVFTAAPAFAQWQTPNHSVPLGRGVGVTGFGNVLPGAAGQLLTSNGSAADPSFQAPPVSPVVPAPVTFGVLAPAFGASF